tara:strand:+ start:245 stop:538 length:294 start_codon:yes stop_codon:yes gene_type:complete
MATQREISFISALVNIAEREKLGLPTANHRSYIYWQGNHTVYSYGHLDIETVRHLSWTEFVADNIESYMMGPHPNQYRKYNKALTWEEIEAIKDITK